MDRRLRAQGCLLALAVGDAMGYTVDDKLWPQIREDYGPDGLRGYDLVNGYAAVSSYTQLAAMGCCGLLVGLTRGQLRGATAPLIRYMERVGRDWAAMQRRSTGDSICWVARREELQARRCMEQLMPDSYLRTPCATMTQPTNRFRTPGALPLAVAAGMTLDPKQIPRQQISRLGAEAVALTHGHPMAFLSGGALAWLVNVIVWDGEKLTGELVREACQDLRGNFAGEFPQAGELSAVLNAAVAAARLPGPLQEKLERLEPDSADRVLAGAILSILACPEDPDGALIAAVNHSGRSAACGCVTGALLGAQLGVDNIPDFYLDCLEAEPILRQLAQDVGQGSTTGRDSGLFDDEWDRKYVQWGR